MINRLIRIKNFATKLNPNWSPYINWLFPSLPATTTASVLLEVNVRKVRMRKIKLTSFALSIASPEMSLKKRQFNILYHFFFSYHLIYSTLYIFSFLKNSISTLYGLFNAKIWFICKHLTNFQMLPCIFLKNYTYSESWKNLFQVFPSNRNFF